METVHFEEQALYAAGTIEIHNNLHQRIKVETMTFGPFPDATQARAHLRTIVHAERWANGLRTKIDKGKIPYMLINGTYTPINFTFIMRSAEIGDCLVKASHLLRSPNILPTCARETSRTGIFELTLRHIANLLGYKLIFTGYPVRIQI